MTLPIALSDVTILFVAISLILLVITEYMSPADGQMFFIVNKKRLRQAALWTGALSALTIVFEIVLLLTFE